MNWHDFVVAFGAVAFTLFVVVMVVACSGFEDWWWRK